MDKTGDKSFADIVSLLNATVTNDNKATIREFLELMKKCQRGHRVVDNKYSHIPFVEDDNVNFKELSENPVSDNILKTFMPKEGYVYRPRLSNTFFELFGQQISTCLFQDVYRFDIMTGNLVEEKVGFDAWFNAKSSSVEGYLVKITNKHTYNTRNVYTYDLSHKLKSIECVSVYGSTLLNVSINDDGRITIIVKRIDVIKEYPNKIQEYINDLKANKQLIDEFYLAPKYFKKA